MLNWQMFLSICSAMQHSPCWRCIVVAGALGLSCTDAPEGEGG